LGIVNDGKTASKNSPKAEHRPRDWPNIGLVQNSTEKWARSATHYEAC